MLNDVYICKKVWIKSRTAQRTKQNRLLTSRVSEIDPKIITEIVWIKSRTGQRTKQLRLLTIRVSEIDSKLLMETLCG